MTPVLILDNEGKTFDRYTFFFKGDGVLYHMYGASEHPEHPQGFGQYAGDTTIEAIREMAEDGRIGKPIQAIDLPPRAFDYFLWLSSMPFENVVLIAGNPFGQGFTVIGPFGDHDAASDWAASEIEEDWWTVTLISPEDV